MPSAVKNANKFDKETEKRKHTVFQIWYSTKRVKLELSSFTYKKKKKIGEGGFMPIKKMLKRWKHFGLLLTQRRLF